MLHLPRRRPGYAAVAATAALVLASAGTGVAAGRLIDGASLKQGSVSAAKLKPAARAAFTRQARVLQADMGPRGGLSDPGATVDVATLAVPAGSWLLTGTATVLATGGEVIANCSVRPAGAAADALVSPPSTVSVPSSRAIAVSAAVPVRLTRTTTFVTRCTQVDGTGQVQAGGSLTALEVGSVARAAES